MTIEPLMNAADTCNGSVDIIRLRLYHVADVIYNDDYGDTVLHRAGRWGKDEAANLASSC